MQLLLAYSSLALSLAAVATPHPHTARDNVITTCMDPTVVSNSTAQVGNNTVLMEILACTAVSTPATANGLAEDFAIGGSVSIGLGSILCDLLPFVFCPPKPYRPPPKPSKTITTTKTIVKTTTSTDTATQTVVYTTTDTVTATVTVSATPTAAPTPVNVCGEICDVTCSGEVAGQLPPTTDDCQVIKDSITIFAGNSAPTFIVPSLHIQQLTFGTCRYFFENLGTDSIEYCWQDLSNQGSLAGTTCFPPTMPLNSLGICEAQDTTWEVGVGHS